MMLCYSILSFLCLFVFANGEIESSKDANITEQMVAKGQKKVSEQIMEILEHYKQEDPVGLPESPVDDPMAIPDMKKSFSVATMNFKTMTVHGLSKFRIERMTSNVADMEVGIELRIEELIIRGKYTMSTWLSRSAGDFNVTLQNVLVNGKAMLDVNKNGQLEAQDINLDITFQSIAMNFQNLGFMGSIFQGIINSVGSFLFENIKPFILSEVNTRTLGDVNKQLLDVPQRFPNSIPPLDMAVAEGRKFVRTQGYDPYRVPDYNHTSGVVTVYLRNTWVTGFASFYRVGNVTVLMANNTLHIGIHMGSQRVRGSCLWEVEFAGYLSKDGSTAFSVEYIQVDVTVAQALDIRKRPKLENLDLLVGNIQVRVDGAGTLDYVAELVVNVIPNILRYQIVDAMENPLKQRIQTILDSIDVEKAVEENLAMVDDLEKAALSPKE